MGLGNIFNRKVLKTAVPALLLLLFIFISLMFLSKYTEAAYLVIILWIAMPVIAIQIYRKIKHWIRKSR